MHVLLPTDYHIRNIHTQVYALPPLPSINQRGNESLLDMIVSRCVKIAGTNINQRESEFANFVAELNYNLANKCDAIALQQLYREMQSFVTFLVHKYTENGWYDSEFGECSLRFTEFTSIHDFNITLVNPN